MADQGEIVQQPPDARSASAPSVAAPVELVLCGRTDVGLVREHNEDSYLLVRLDDGVRDPATLGRHPLAGRGTLLCVCDGMGGAAAGEVASNMAVESLAETMALLGSPPAPDGQVDDGKTQLARKLRGAARDANLRIFREARENLARAGMGTTMTALLLRDGYAVIAQVGDSRAYLWRQGAFVQVTRDQSLVNQLLETGHITPEQAKFFEHSNVILQALGVQEEVEVQLSKVELRRGDRFLICSDGLVGVVTDEEIGAVVGSVDDPQDAARILIEMANAAGGPDNISVIVARVEGEGVPAPTAEEVVQYQLWRIDPEPAALDPGGVETDRLPLMAEDRADAEEAPDGEADPRRATYELLSMAVVVGLILGSLVAGMALYRGGVVCEVEAPRPGLAVLTDGRDSGVRTGEGPVPLRLRAGHHTVALGSRSEAGTQEVDVAEHAACVLNFTSAER